MPDIPQSAWCATLTRLTCEIAVGRSVEIGQKRIVEGVWDGDFAEDGFIHSSSFFGSGISWKKRLIFVPPRHAWEYLFVLHDRKTQRTYVSNSLNFALAQAGVAESDPVLSRIEDELFDSTNRATEVGVDLYDPHVTQTDRFSLRRMMFYNFEADFKGRVTVLPLKLEVAPLGFAAYRAFLVHKIAAITANGSSPRRRRKMPPITPISNGYDSPCVAILAKDAGVTDTITLDITVKGQDDSGASIAEDLGLNVIKVTHVLGADVPRLAVSFSGALKAKIAEFIATAGVGDDVAFLPFEPHIENRIFLSGALGDSIWRRNSNLPPGLPVRVVYGKSLTEFRLRTGFAFVPVPAIGARFPRPVKRMTRSPEMADFTLKKAYDRPFPRRVIEEAGIARNAFAQSKAATSPTPKNRSDLFRPATLEMIARYQSAAPGSETSEGLVSMIRAALRRRA